MILYGMIQYDTNHNDTNITIHYHNDTNITVTLTNTTIM